MNYLEYSAGIDVSKADFKANISVIEIHQKVSVKASSTFSNTIGLKNSWFGLKTS